MSDRMSSQHNSRALWLLAIAIVIALVFAGGAMTQASQKKAPVKKAAAPAPKASDPCVGPHVAPVVNGVATIKISQVGSTLDLQTDYDRACISTTEQVEWKWTGDPTKDWYVEFYAGANPFPKNKYGKANPKSDKPTAHANKHLIYKYLIHVQGFNDLDPDVIIR